MVLCLFISYTILLAEIALRWACLPFPRLKRDKAGWWQVGGLTVHRLGTAQPTDLPCDRYRQQPDLKLARLVVSFCEGPFSLGLIRSHRRCGCLCRRPAQESSTRQETRHGRLK